MNLIGLQDIHFSRPPAPLVNATLINFSSSLSDTHTSRPTRTLQPPNLFSCKLHLPSSETLLLHLPCSSKTAPPRLSLFPNEIMLSIMIRTAFSHEHCQSVPTSHKSTIEQSHPPSRGRKLLEETAAVQLSVNALGPETARCALGRERRHLYRMSRASALLSHTWELHRAFRLIRKIGDRVKSPGYIYIYLDHRVSGARGIMDRSTFSPAMKFPTWTSAFLPHAAGMLIGLAAGEYSSGPTNPDEGHGPQS